jgi:hypothetical protein
MALAIADRRIMDRRVESAERIDLGCDIPGAGNGRDIADHHRLYFGQRPPGILGAGRVAGMKDDCVALARKLFARHQAEAGRRAGNEDA